MKCPVCKQRIKYLTEDWDEGVLEEREASCIDLNKKHYYYYHYYKGATEEVIGTVVFHSSYTDTDEIRELQSKQYNAVLELEKEYYKKS